MKHHIKPQTVLFHRDFIRFGGGHLKVWNYFQALMNAADFEPAIYFTERSRWDKTNPWLGLRGSVRSEWTRQQADVIFLAGLDWVTLDSLSPEDVTGDTPIVNLIQGVRHANPEGPLFRYLNRRAVRICVSDQVAEALRNTGQVNGPLYVIPNGLDLAPLSLYGESTQSRFDVLIVGFKQPELAQRLERSFRASGLDVVTILTPVPRAEFLAELRSARITVTLPLEQEGFYLPALESMALGSLVVCPDCIGNRSFCIDGRTCAVPDYNFDAIVSAVTSLRTMLVHEQDERRQAALAMADCYSLEKERTAFLGIMQDIHSIWRTA